jgi:hypothetical protein
MVREGKEREGREREREKEKKRKREMRSRRGGKPWSRPSPAAPALAAV